MDLAEYSIRQLMTPSPEILSEDQTIALALNKMSMGNYRHVPIRRADGSIYMLSVGDVLRYVF